MSESKKVLLMRFGGIGDIFPTLAVARYLKEKGHEVTVAFREDDEGNKQTRLCDGLGITTLDYKGVGPWGNRCVQTENGWVNIQTIFKDFDLVVDYTNIIENNSTSPHNDSDPTQFWQRSRSSNWVNWYDLHYAWANIDPNTVPEEHKRPHLVLSADELVLIAEFRAKYSHLFMVSPFASSLARSWYQAKDMVQMVLRNKAYENPAILFWEPGVKKWVLVTKQGAGPAPILCEDALRNSMAFVSAADLVVSVDTGISHIAEGLGTKSLVIYSTVPWWTRAKYYTQQEHIDLGEYNPNYYTFSLGLGDPLRIKEGREALTEREKHVEKLYNSGAAFEVAVKELNTDSRGAEMELTGLKAKFESWERIQAVALSLVNPTTVYEKVKEIVK